MKVFQENADGKPLTENQAYLNAVDRCTNPKNPRYKDYGGRGITFEFIDYHHFMAEVGRKPTPQHSLDRIRNEEGYKPGNVRWSTPKEQAANRRPHPSGYRCNNGVPVITIYVRHSAGCKYAGDEFTQRCRCRKHFRWTQDGKQHRRTAGTRSWSEAEEGKRSLEAQISGRAAPARGKAIEQAIEVFIQDKKNQEVTPKVLAKYQRELDRLKSYCEVRGVFAVSALTKELLTGYAGTWAEAYPASSTRSRVRDRLSTFLRYCYDAEWLPRIPRLSPVKVEQNPTMPLTAEEYAQLLDTTYATFADEPGRGARVRALIQLMRFSGLAIRDALTLRRNEIVHDQSNSLYLITTARQKTGVHVMVPIPSDVAKEVLAVTNGNPEYVFWSGVGDEESATKNWSKYLARLFDDAKIKSGHMRSHRLRDTFACDLLEKGVPLEEVSKLLGHESIKTTEKSYSAWVKGRQDRLNSLVTATWK